MMRATHRIGSVIRGLALACGALACGIAAAAGPLKMAVIDRSVYPAAINTPAGFDQASRLEILAFVRALDRLAPGPEEQGVARASVEKWRTLTMQRLTDNWKAAHASCKPGADLYCDAVVKGSDDLAALARSFPDRLPATLKPWLDAADAFHTAYAGEQQRLAAYFPRISSEVLTYGDAERTGFEFKDRSFMLSFDDGPTAAGGNTDALLARLREHDLHAQFFMLGENLNTRRARTSSEDLKKLYAGQCVAAHGYKHESHQKMPQWQESVISTTRLLDEVFGPASEHYFRPPYAQRVPEAAAILGAQHTRIVLWNLDSQDWSARMPVERVPDRMLTLMLVWRRGILLFHDIHPKAQAALPQMLKALDGSGVNWMDCRSYR